MEYILVYLLVMDNGIESIEYRFDMLFPHKQACRIYATTQENIKYMQDHFKGKSIRMVYPACDRNPYQGEPIGLTG